METLYRNLYQPPTDSISDSDTVKEPQPK